MPLTPDHQLGAELRLRRPAGSVNRQVLEGMVRDLVGADQSLLAPLLHLVGRPTFLALDPKTASHAVCLVTHDQWLMELAETYHPRVVSRLCEVLEGYLQLGGPEAPSEGEPVNLNAIEQVEPRPFSHTPPAGPATPTPSALMAAAPSASASALDAPADHSEGSTPHPIAQPAGRTPRRWLPLQIGLAVLASTFLAVAVQRPPLCRGLGICTAPNGADAQGSTASSRALAAAGKAAKAMKAARDLPSYQKALSDLDRELLRLSGDSLSAGQQQQRDALQAIARDGLQHLNNERKQAKAVASATRRLDKLDSVPAERQEAERTTARQELEAIPASSFSHRAAQQQQRRLLAPPPPQAPPAEPSESAAPAPAPESSPAPAAAPTPAPAPRRAAPASDGSWGGGGSTWSPPRRQAPGAPARDDGNSNAPYRDDPLF